MFERVDIRLSGPICDCPDQHLVWDLVLDAERAAGLRIRCEKCGTYLSVPPGKFKARFVLEEPYPGDEGEDGEDARVLHLVPRLPRDDV